MVYVVKSDKKNPQRGSGPYFISKVTLKLSPASFLQYTTYLQ